MPIFNKPLLTVEVGIFFLQRKLQVQRMDREAPPTLILVQFSVLFQKYVCVGIVIIGVCINEN